MDKEKESSENKPTVIPPSSNNIYGNCKEELNTTWSWKWLRSGDGPDTREWRHQVCRQNDTYESKAIKVERTSVHLYSMTSSMSMLFLPVFLATWDDFPIVYKILTFQHPILFCFSFGTVNDVLGRKSNYVISVKHDRQFALTTYVRIPQHYDKMCINNTLKTNSALLRG